MATDSLARLEISCIEGRLQSIRYRQHIFHSLYKTLKSFETPIKNAIVADTGYGEIEVNLEYGLLMSELRLQYDTLNLEEDLRARDQLHSLGATKSVGIVYLVPSKYNLLYSTVSALLAAIAAGNCVVIELPTTLSQVSCLLRKILPSALDKDTFSLTTTRPSERFLGKCFFLSQVDGDEAPGSQSTDSAKVVAIVDRSSDISKAASMIGSARILFKGQSPYAPDVVLVNEFVADDFLHHLIGFVTTEISSRRPEEPQPAKKDVKTEQSTKYIDNIQYCKVIMSGAKGMIIEISSNSDKSRKWSRIRDQVIVFQRVTSLDNAIDMCNSIEHPLECSYIFAAPTEASYVARNIDARLSCMNHIPTELLIGPLAPKIPSHVPNPSPRYSPQNFRLPRPRLKLTSCLTDTANEVVWSRSTKPLESWAKLVAAQPLPEIRQADGRATGFFDQAIMVLGATVVLTIISGAFIAFRVLGKK